MSISINKIGDTTKGTKIFVCLFFAALFFTGLFVYDDYGMSWDERSQWESNGHANVDFILGNDNNALLASGDKYHGPAFEIVLVIIEKVFHLTDSRSIFLMRHLVAFLLFFISGIFFYLLAKKITTYKWIATFGVMMYYFSPHIFANSFYNTKDVVFLSLFTISVYWLIKFLDKQTIATALVFAAFTGFTIDVRIMGLIIPFILVMIIAGSVLTKKNEYKWKYVFAYFALTCFFIFLFWPVLWDNPIHHFIGAFKEAFFYHWEIDVLYRGQIYKSSELPWHYLPFWVFVSKPVVYCLLLVTGTFFIMKRFFVSPISFIRDEKKLQVLSWMFFLPFLLVIFSGSILFDTGRHMFFLNSGFLLIAVFGLEQLVSMRNRVFRIIVVALLSASLLKVVADMVKMHPYQNLYFNECMNGDMQHVKENFELDYWGVASRAVLENIATRDTSKSIKIYTDHYPIILNLRILAEEDRKRISITDTVESADYYVAGYRWHEAKEHEGQSEFYSVKVGNAKVITAFKFRKSEELFNSHGLRLFYNKNDFEKKQEAWSSITVGAPQAGAYSGQYALTVNKAVSI